MATNLSQNGIKERAKGSSSKDHSIRHSPELEAKEVPQEVVNGYLKNINLPGKADYCRPITIFRLPLFIREKNKAMHEPKLVSIGPYYHDPVLLKTMEEHKWWCLRDFIETHSINLPNVIQKIGALEADARQCYSETLSSETLRLGTDEFVQMLILDGCFILEFIRKHYGAVSDSFFDIERNRETILNDILLVENQIPFFILHELYNLATGTSSSCCGHSCKLRDLIFGLLPSQILWRQPQLLCRKVHHLLHFYYLCMVPNPGSMRAAGKTPSQKSTKYGAKVTLAGIEHGDLTKIRNYNADKEKPPGIPSVNELHEKGIRFKRKKKPRHLFDITFEHGVMEVPTLYIDDLHCVLLANILAFEQISYGPRETISHFVSFMDNLIDTKFDVARLERRGILINMIGSEGEAANFFNELGKWNLVEPSADYQRLISEVQGYVNSPWPKYRATLMRDYFMNPWTTISVIAAIILLGLTFVQTYYTIYPVVHGN